MFGIPAIFLSGGPIAFAALLIAALASLFWDPLKKAIQELLTPFVRRYRVELFLLFYVLFMLSISPELSQYWSAAVAAAAVLVVFLWRRFVSNADVATLGLQVALLIVPPAVAAFVQHRRVDPDAVVSHVFSPTSPSDNEHRLTEISQQFRDTLHHIYQGALEIHPKYFEDYSRNKYPHDTAELRLEPGLRLDNVIKGETFRPGDATLSLITKPRRPEVQYSDPKTWIRVEGHLSSAKILYLEAACGLLDHIRRYELLELEEIETKEIERALVEQFLEFLAESGIAGDDPLYQQLDALRNAPEIGEGEIKKAFETYKASLTTSGAEKMLGPRKALLESYSSLR